MRFKKIIFITFLFVAILSITMVSASEDADNLSNDSGNDYSLNTYVGDVDLVSDDATDNSSDDGSDGEDDFEDDDWSDDVDDFEDDDWSDDGSDDVDDFEDDDWSDDEDDYEDDGSDEDDDWSDDEDDYEDDDSDEDDYEDDEVDLGSFQATINGDEIDISEINDAVAVSFYCPENVTGEIIIFFDEAYGLEDVYHVIQESEWNTTVSYTPADLGIDEGGFYFIQLCYQIEDGDEMWLCESEIKVIDESQFRADFVSQYGWPQVLDENTYYYIYYPIGSAEKTVHVNVRNFGDAEIKDFSVVITENDTNGFIMWTLSDLGMVDRDMYLITVEVDNNVLCEDEIGVESPASIIDRPYIGGKRIDSYIASVFLSPEIKSGQVIIVINGTEYFNKGLDEIKDTEIMGGVSNNGRIDHMISVDDLNPGLDEGIYEVELTYTYENYTFTETADIKILKANIVKDNATGISIEIFDEDIYEGDDSCIAKIMTPANVTGNVVLYINDDVYYNRTLEDFEIFGEEDDTSMVYQICQENFESLTAGTYDVKVIFSNDDVTLTNNDTVDILSRMSIEIDPSDILCDAYFDYFAFLKVYFDMELDGKIAVYLNGTEYLNCDVEDFEEDFISHDGCFVYYNLAPAYMDADIESGIYDVTVVYCDDETYINSSATINFTDDNIIIIVPDIIDYYNSSEMFHVDVKDAGMPVVNAPVNVTINGKTYEKTIRWNSTYSEDLAMNSGKYNVTDEYGDSKAISTVTLNETVTADNFTKMFRNATQYEAVFVDSKGNPLNDTEVELNIHGVLYYRTTDSKGVARLNINLNPGEYILTAKNPSTGEMRSTLINVLPIIVENSNLIKYYRNDSQYTLRILGDDGKAVGAGEVVTLNINGVMYNRTTNESGYIKLNINLNPGEYIITAQYKGLMASNLINVLPVLETGDLNMKFLDGSKFEAKILDGQGRASANQTVTFNINGVLYNRTSDSEGFARLNINLMAGEYIITSTYNGLSASNKVTISS